MEKKYLLLACVTLFSQLHIYSKEQQSEVNSDEIVVTNADENTEIEKDEKEIAVTGVDEQSTES